MYRNTALLIFFLGIFAAVVVGVNFGRLTAPHSSNTQPSSQSTTLANSPTPTPQPLTTYKNDDCGIAVQYPANYTTITSNTAGITFLNPLSPVDATSIQCQSNLPKLYAKGSTTSTVAIGSVSATLYTPPPATTPSLVDKKKLYFRNESKKKDILISGSGETFDSLIQNLQISQ